MSVKGEDTFITEESLKILFMLELFIYVVMGMSSQGSDTSLRVKYLPISYVFEAFMVVGFSYQGADKYLRENPLHYLSVLEASFNVCVSAQGEDMALRW